MAAPIENQVEQMKDFGLKYAVLINPRYSGWDNSYISYSLHKYPKLFVAHGLINPEDPKVAETVALLGEGARISGHALQPHLPSEIDVAEFEGALSAVERSGEAGAVFNYYILPHQMPMLEEMAGRFPGVKIVVDHLGKPDLKRARSLARISKDVPVERNSRRSGSAHRSRTSCRSPKTTHIETRSVLQGGVRRVRREAADLGHRLSSPSLGVADGQRTGICR